jgi:ribonuclease J
MNITIHRGSNQIGGCVTEYEHEGWKVFVDYGQQLPGVPQTGKLQVDGLTYGDLSKSILLITHYHGDHIGNIDVIPPAVSIYLGVMSLEIVQTLEEKLSRARRNAPMADHAKRLRERLNLARTLRPGVAMSFGPFTILPLTIDHSAFDAYAFKIIVDGVSVFHTGDFRTHGFRGSKFEQLIKQYVGRVNYLVCEATNVKRHQTACATERDLQQEFERRFKMHRIHLVYVSSTNIDRLFSLYHAACRAQCIFYVDAYQKKIMDAVANAQGPKNKSPLYRYSIRKPTVLKRAFGTSDFLCNDHFLTCLKERGGVFAVRAAPQFQQLIAKLPHESLQIYLSMWNGYVKKGPAYQEQLASAVGNDYIYLHTSGHCDLNSLEQLIGWLRPQAVIPIHTDCPEEFERLFGGKYPVRHCMDGETFAAL